MKNLIQHLSADVKRMQLGGDAQPRAKRNVRVRRRAAVGTPVTRQETNPATPRWRKPVRLGLALLGALLGVLLFILIAHQPENRSRENKRTTPIRVLVSSIGSSAALALAAGESG